VAAWVAQLEERVTVAPKALAKLSRLISELGFERAQGVLTGAVAAAEDRLEELHIPTDGYHAVLVDELLAERNPLAAMEKRLLRQVLERSDWRMQEAAERLRISRVTLWRKLRDHGIERPE
jgi:transcriptional regulator of acetoin/glycerol metabolism